MNKKFVTFLGIGLFLILLIWEADRHSSVRIIWRSQDEFMPLAGLLLWLLLFTFLVCVINDIIHKVVHKQMHEALTLTDNKIDESLPIDKLSAQSEKLVLKRTEFDNAMMLLLQATTAVTAGDMDEARQALSALRKIIGNDMIIDVLTLKIYKGEKNFDKMEELSAKLIDNPNLQLVGMKASLEAQLQKKEFEHALQTANKAFEVRQDLYWVIESAFNLRAKADDWEGALQVLNSGYKKQLISPEQYKTLKAVSLYQLALAAKAKGDNLNFFKFCTQALDTCNTLVPAALSLARYYVENDNQIRKAAKILSKIWRCNPTAEVAEAYLNLWPNDKPIERVQRMESLALTNSIRPSLNNLLLAELDLKAGLRGKTKSEFEIFLINNPATKLLAKLIYEYEKTFNKDPQAAENWKNKAGNCAQDSVWMCQDCGHNGNEWLPVCPKCGTVGKYKWHLYIKNKD